MSPYKLAASTGGLVYYFCCHTPYLCRTCTVLQALLFQGSILHFLVFAVLIVFVVLEATHHVAQGHKKTVFVASAAIGGICVGLSTVQGYLLVRALQQIRQRQKRW